MRKVYRIDSVFESSLKIKRWFGKNNKRKAFATLALAFLVGVPLSFFLLNKNGSQANWWNESWTYRKSVQVTNNVTAENNVYVLLSLDTSDTTKFQNDCGDLRFTKKNGQLLPYYIASGCGTASTSVQVNFDTFDAGVQTIFYYFGNPSVENGFASSGFSAQASNYTIGTIGAEEIGPGPVGYWNFDEGYGATAYDQSSYKNNGAITGGTWQTEDQCVSGKCLRLDGKNESKISANIANNLQSFSACAWVRPNSFTNTDSDVTITIFSKRWSLNFDNNGKLSFNIPTTAAYVNYNSSSNLERNKWNYVCVSFPGVGQASKLYINSLDVSNTVSVGSGTSLDNSAYNLRIGTTQNDWTNNYNGFIDEAKIYPYARTAEQIKQDYSAGLAGVGTSGGASFSLGGNSQKWMSDGLVGHWKMDEPSWNGTAGEVKDASGNSNHGTRVGDATTAGGKFGNGGTLDGTGDYANIPDLTQINDSAEMTVCSWVYLNTLGTGSVDDGAVFSRSGNGSANNVLLWYDYDTGFGVNRTYTFNVGNSFDSNNRVYAPANVVKAADWQYVCGVMNGTYRAIFVDGELKSSHSNATQLTIGNTTDDPRLGSWVYSGNFDHNGKLDDVRVYKRALSNDEVKKLYEYAPGPVLHLKMDEKSGTTLNDTSGNGNNATLNNSPIFETGKYGGAVNFDKTDDYALTADSPSLTIKNSITIQLWIKPNALPTSDWTAFVEKGNYSNGYLFATGSGNMRDLSFWYAGTDIDSGEVLNIGEWQNIAVTYDGAQFIIYHNGIPIQTKAHVGSAAGNTSGLNLGRSPTWGASRNFNGAMDDVRIYNYARTQKQILEDMGSVSGGVASSQFSARPSRPVAHWKFDAGYGATAYDEMGVANGTLNSGATGANTSVTQMWDKDGKFSRALEFDGDDFVDIGTNSNLQPTTELTVSAWVTRSANLSSFLGIVSSQKQTQAMGYLLAGDVNNKIRFYIWDGAWKYAISDSALNLNEFYYLTGIWDGSTVKLYVNGKLQSVTASASTIIYPSTPDENHRIGRYSNGEWIGKIDETKIFNYALTSDEVKQEYNQSTGTAIGSIGIDASGNKTNSANREHCVLGDATSCVAPVLELKMDEKTGTVANDTSGNGNNGTLGGDGAGTDLPAWGLGKIGSGLRFDGDDYVDINNNSGLDIVGDKITVSAWFKANSTSGIRRIVSAPSNEVVGDEKYAILINVGQAEFYIRTGTVDTAVSTPFTDTNGWHYIAGVYDGATMKIYIDGIEKNSVSKTGNIAGIDAGAKVQIGRFGPTWGQYFDGNIDNVKIYNYARTPAQIAWDYNKGGPIAYWKMDECQGNVAHDEINGNNGTISIGAAGAQTSVGTCETAGTAWGNGKAGKKNASLNFDGGDDYANVGDLNFMDGASQLTVSAWMRRNSLSAPISLAKGSNCDTDLVGINMWTNGNLYFDVKNGSSVFGYTVLNDTSWHYVTLVFDGSKSGTSRLKGYVDGVAKNLQYNGTPSATLPTNSNSLFFGRVECSGLYSDGQIDDVKIFNYPLTAEQVKLEYSGGAMRF